MKTVKFTQMKSGTKDEYLLLDKYEQDLDFLRLEKESFKRCPNIAIDVAVMEKTQE